MHVFGGYDVKTNRDACSRVEDHRLRFLRGSINDSLFDLGSHKDRHTRIGEGFIGLEALRKIAHHEAFSGLPMILETPNEPPEHGEEMKLLR